MKITEEYNIPPTPADKEIPPTPLDKGGLWGELRGDAIDILKALSNSFARKNLMDFTIATHRNYNPNWHHYLIADRLEMFARGEIKKLIVNMPPRHGKSELISRRFPGWYFGNYEYKELMLICYDMGLAEDMGADARDIIASMEYRNIFKDRQLAQENSAKAKWRVASAALTKPCNKCGYNNWIVKAFGRAICKSCGNLGEFAGQNVVGRYVAAGVNGSVTGRGADKLMIDDPIKNRQDAESPVMRKAAWSFFASTAYTRMEEDIGICIIQTRWHEDDLTGRALALEKDEWHVLRLPAIAVEDEQYELHNKDYAERLGKYVGRKKGEPLWADKYDIDRLLGIKRTIGSYEFNALYQQTPSPAESGIFKKEYFQYYTLAGDFLAVGGENLVHRQMDLAIFCIADLAATTSTHSDYTVITTWGSTRDGRLFLLDMFRDRIEGARHIDILNSIYQKWTPDYIGIESVQYQISLVQQAKRQGLPAIELKADKDKWTRALPASAMFEAGLIFFPTEQHKSWIDEVENELISFPYGKHDDIVDTVAYAALRSQKRKRDGFEFYTPSSDKELVRNGLRGALSVI